MSKTFSLGSLFVMIIFLVLTYTTSIFQVNVNETDKFGFPFVFFSAANNGEVVNITNFSALALLADFGICAILGMGLVYILSHFNPSKKTAVSQ
jgi:hypothetical protein